MIIPHNAHPKGGYRMEDELFDNIKVLPKRIEKDKDVLGIWVGSPGEGKSTHCQQVMYALDPSLTISDVYWDSDDYIRNLASLFEKGQGTSKFTKGKAAIHDEGKRDMSSLSVLTKKTRHFMDFLYENRQMNCYQAILTGDFFDLPKSIVMNRIMFMVYVHEEGEFENGYFKFFNREDAKNLYLRGKKDRNMKASKYSFRGTFPKFYTVDEKLYRDAKANFLSIDRFIDKEDKAKMTIKDVVKWILERNPNPKPAELARVLQIDYSFLYKIRSEIKGEIDKEGKEYGTME